MADNIPVFFFAAGPDEAPHELIDWTQAEEVIASRMEDGGLYQTTSRNWWHQRLLLDLAKHERVSGLEFLEQSAASLCGKPLTAAIAALKKVVGALETGEVAHLASVDAEVFEDPSWRQAFAHAEPGKDSSAEVDVGFEANVAFFSWVKTLAVVATEAAAEGKCLVVVQPQP